MFNLALSDRSQVCQGIIPPRYQVVRGLNNLGYSKRVACQAVRLRRPADYKIKYRQPTDRDIRQVMLADWNRRTRLGE